MKMTEQMREKSRDERGFVLITVLIIVAILTTLVVDMMYYTQVDGEIARNTGDVIKARYLAKSGVNFVAGTMLAQNLEEFSELAMFRGEDEDGGEGMWSIVVPGYPIGDGSVAIEIVDERSKINLNALVSRRTNRVDEQVRTQITELLRFLEVDGDNADDFISSLINWLDRPLLGVENDQDPGGAREGYYRGLDTPYTIKNGTLDSVEEIRMVRGMDDEFYNKIKDFVTVYPPGKKVSFSTAPKVVIMAVLKSAMVSAVQRRQSAETDELRDDVADTIAGRIMEERQNESVVTRRRVIEIVREVDATLNINSGLAGVVHSTGASDVFGVRAVGVLGQDNPTVKVVRAVVRRSRPGQSPAVRVISWKEN